MASDRSPSSGLFYCDTGEEVELGDRVRIRRWFRRPLEGVVCHIPGLSQSHPELEYAGTRQWAIELADGSLRVMGYYPRHLQPERGMELVERGAPYTGLDPNTPMEGSGTYEGDDDDDAGDTAGRA